jgi:O-antigen ligase
MLVWAPLPLASNRSWALGLLSIWVWLVLFLALYEQLRSGRPVMSQLKHAKWPLLCLGSFAMLIFVQLVGSGSEVVEKISPWLIDKTISLDPYNTRQYLLATLCYLAAFVLTQLLVRRESDVLLLLVAFIFSGVVQSLVAILLFASKAEYNYFFMHFTQGDRASGTFANWDHLAGYLEMCLSLGVGLMLSRSSGETVGKQSIRNRIVAILKFLLSVKMLVRLMLIVMVIALVLTHSRMGNAAFFISLLLVGAFGMMANKRIRKSAFWLLLSLVLVDVLIVGQWIGVDRVVQRLQGTAISTENARGEETLEQRILPARESLPAIMERPWLGFGGGTFYTAFPRFKQDDLLPYYDHAHNDYIEIAMDTGILGFSLLAMVVLLSIWRLRLLWSFSQPRINRGVAFGVSMAMLCMLIHGFVDFNLQIPANALTFTIVVALVWVLDPKYSRLNE